MVRRLTVQEFDQVVDTTGCEFEAPLSNAENKRRIGTFVTLLGLTETARRCLKKYPFLSPDEIINDCENTRSDEEMVFVEDAEWVYW